MPNVIPSAIRDVCEMSAAVLYNRLPDLLTLPASDLHAALVTHFEACLAAFRECQQWQREPSEN